MLGENLAGHRRCGLPGSQMTQGCFLLWSQLRVPSGLEFRQTDVPNLAGALFVGDVLADRRDVAVGLLRFPFQQFARLPVDLLVTFGKLLDQRRGNPSDVKIPPGLVVDLVAEPA